MSNGIGQVSGDSGLTNKALNQLQNNSANAQDELKRLFKEQYFNNGQSGIDDIEDKMDQVQRLIKGTQDKITELNRKIDESNRNINGAAEELANIVKEIAKKTDEYQEAVEDKIDQSMRMAVEKTKSDMDRSSNKDDKANSSTFAENFRAYFTSNGGDRLAPNVSGLFDRQSASESKIKGYIKNIDGLLSENGLLSNKMQNEKSTLQLLGMTQKNLTAQKEGYTNSNNNSSVPIYSPAKEAFVDDLLATYNSRLDDTTNTSKSPTAQNLTPEERSAQLKSLTEQYAPKDNQQYKSGDKYNADKNPELGVLDKAVKDGMLGKLANLGLNRTEILKFVGSNFDVGIQHQDNGNYTIPYGHNSQQGGIDKTANGAGAIYNNFISTLDKATGTKVDPSKTLGGNNQMKEMQKAISNDGLLEQFQSKGFTFKEAMYALTKLFPGAGVGYDLSKQSTGPSYSIPYGDDAATHTFMQSMSDKIKNIWSVGSTMGSNPADNNNNKPPNRTDPIGFKVGDTDYEFLTSNAMDNGKFDGVGEMLGSKDGIKELQDLAKQVGSNNGVITGEDSLKQVILMTMKHIPDGKDGYKLEPAFTNAWDLGIREINTNGTPKQDSGNTKTDYTNINNSLVQNTFGVKMLDGNGKMQDIKGEQKYDTQDYINATYNKAVGENIFSKLKDSDVDNVFAQNRFTNEKAGNLQNQRDELQGALDASESALSQDSIEDIKEGVSIRLDNAIGAGFYEYKKEVEKNNKHLNEDDAGNKGAKDIAAEAAIKAFQKKLDIDKIDDYKEITDETQEQSLEKIKEQMHPDKNGQEK